ncbi:hypothetical protein MMC07_001872 [Pseudocyphellaria aurata]|nr:hypothetical protein [Pseudocyphellaria aurata]
MPSQPTIPPLLSTLLSPLPPAGSLTLLTSVLSTSTNWLVLRIIHAALKPPDSHRKDLEVSVVLVSWLRGWDTWCEGARRLGMDFSKGSRVAFVDGLGGKVAMSGMNDIETEIMDTVKRQKNEGGAAKVLLVLDGVDYLVAGTGAEVEEVMDMVQEIRDVGLAFSYLFPPHPFPLPIETPQPKHLRARVEEWDGQADRRKLFPPQHVYATIVTCAADSALMHRASTPLETNHAALVTAFAHQARVILGVRGLDTGTARDVSGVLRVGRGGDGGGDGEAEVEEKEVLYFAAADGGVRVFERGS